MNGGPIGFSAIAKQHGLVIPKLVQEIFIRFDKSRLLVRGNCLYGVFSVNSIYHVN